MDSFSNSVKYAWIIGLLGIALFSVNSLFIQVRSAIYYSDTTDLSAYYAAAQLKSEQNTGVFDLDLLKQNSGSNVKGRIRPYTYPPWFAEMLTPLGKLDYVAFRVIWITLAHLFLICLFIITLLLCQKLIGKLTTINALICLMAFVLFSPLEREIFYGQVSIFLSVLIHLSLILVFHDRNRWAGILASIATMLKIYPGVILVWFMVNKNISALLSFIIISCLIVCVSVYAYGYEDWISFLELHMSGELSKIGYRLELGVNNIMNVPNYGISHLIFITGLSFGERLDPALCVWLGRGIVIVSVFIFYISLRNTISSQVNSLEFFLALIMWMMLISPVLWNHIYIFLLPGMTLYLVIANNGIMRPSDKILVIISYILIATADYATNLNALNAPFFVILKPVKLYALILLIIFVYRRLARKETLLFVTQITN